MMVLIPGEGQEARVLVGDADAAAAPPAGGAGHDSEPALPPQELWSQLHHQDEDRPAGTTDTHTESVFPLAPSDL